MASRTVSGVVATNVLADRWQVARHHKDKLVMTKGGSVGLIGEVSPARSSAAAFVFIQLSKAGQPRAKSLGLEHVEFPVTVLPVGASLTITQK